MGDPKRLRPKYETPRKIWSKERIEEESKLVEEYGLHNTRELWVTQRELKRIRREARRLLSLGEKGKESGQKLIAKCVRLGFSKEAADLDSLLALSIRDVLDRRLETRVVKRGLARSIKQSRQLIAHGFIAVKGKRVSAPGYIVPVSEDSTITYFKPIDLNAPVMAQKSAAKVEAKEAGTPEAGAEPKEATASEEKPVEAAS